MPSLSQVLATPEAHVQAEQSEFLGLHYDFRVGEDGDIVDVRRAVAILDARRALGMEGGCSV